MNCPALPLRLKLQCLDDNIPDDIRRHPAHPLGGVSIDIQREARAVVAQRVGEGLHIHTVLQGERSERMPLFFFH